MPAPVYFTSSISLTPSGPDGQRKLTMHGYDGEALVALDLVPLLLTQGPEQTELPIERNARKVAARLRDMATVAQAAGNDRLRLELVFAAEMLNGAHPGDLDHPTLESMGLEMALEAAE